MGDSTRCDSLEAVLAHLDRLRERGSLAALLDRVTPQNEHAEQFPDAVGREHPDADPWPADGCTVCGRTPARDAGWTHPDLGPVRLCEEHRDAELDYT